MADSGVLGIEEDSELVVLSQLDDDDKDTLTFSTSNSHELLVDVNELHSASEISSECTSTKVELPSTCSEMSEVDQSDMLGVDILALDQPGQTLHLPDGTVAVIKNLTQLPDNLQVLSVEDGSVTWLASGMLTAEDGISTISADQQLILDAVDVQDDETISDDVNKTEMIRLISSVNQIPSSVGTVEINPTTCGSFMQLPSLESQSNLKKTFVCGYPDCFRRYSTIHHLKVHQRSHTGYRPYLCGFDSCGKSFATSYALKSHRRVHTGEKPYECTVCGCVKAFKTSGDLQKHIRTHTGEKPFMCPYMGCGRAFTTSNIRKVHIRTHTGERPYSCDMPGCGKTFASATNYKNHIRIHSGEKPYICTSEGCGKRFTEYSSLYKHHVVHTHKKPYECTDCGKTYRQTSTLAMHRRMAHCDVASDTSTAVSSAFVLTTVSDKLLINKKPVISFRVVEDGIRPSDDADGNLVIDTSDGHQLIENYEGISVMSTGDPCSFETNSSTAVTSSVLGQLMPSVGLNVKHDDGASRIFVVTDRSQIYALQQRIATCNQQQQLSGLPAS